VLDKSGLGPYLVPVFEKEDGMKGSKGETKVRSDQVPAHFEFECECGERAGGFRTRRAAEREHLNHSRLRSGHDLFAMEVVLG
jgi:hypothetical protein